MKQKVQRWLKLVLAVMFWLGIYTVASVLLDRPLLLPPLTAVGTCLMQLLCSAAFWHTAALTAGRVMLGILGGCVFGILLGAAAAKSELCRALLRPLIQLMKAAPVASFVLLLLLWLPRGAVPVLTAMLVVLPVVWTDVLDGLLHMDRQLLEVGKVFALSPGRVLRRILLPALLPRFAAACTPAFGMAWKAGVAAEVLAVPLWSIGRRLYEAKLYLETTELFAWTAALLLLSAFMEKGLLFLLGYLGGGRKKQRASDA